MKEVNHVAAGLSLRSTTAHEVPNEATKAGHPRDRGAILAETPGAKASGIPLVLATCAVQGCVMCLIGASKALVIYGVVTVLAVALSSPSGAQRAASIFERMSGQWTGEGTIRMTGGGTERIRCRATYRAHDSGGTLRQEMLCASDSYKFQVTSDLIQRAETISGQWVETTRNVSGNIVGQVSGDLIQARVQGAVFAASFAVSTIGDRQAVTIAPQGIDVIEVAITMSRRAR